MNLLHHETSPYLLQHAQNPVHWQAWNEATLQKAEQQDRPIIVSIGYSACHWCHVMEHESFENEAVAAIMNEHFVCIKIDREERPDVDAIYMEAIQAMGLRGGWPLNVFLLPNGKPFYGGTYFKPREWVNLCLQIAEAFRNHRPELEKSANGFVENMQFSESEKYHLLATNERPQFSADELGWLEKKLIANFDYEWGGMKKSPKFPMPCVWEFLLRLNPTSKEFFLTLDRMALGGIHDHLGGGFARYSTDSEWLCPHFEKMLYDNGQLMSLYAEGYKITKKPLYERVLVQMQRWLLAEMQSPEGGFYSALDADSEGEEGLFYTWKKAEIQEILQEKSNDFCQFFGISMAGNYHDEATQKATGKNILFIENISQAQTDISKNWGESMEKLLVIRNQRIRPGLDDKILTSWNALMLKGLTDAYKATGQETYREMATQNAAFLLKNLIIEQENSATCWHTYKNGVAKINGFLDDYATLIQAFTALYEITFEEQYLAIAEKLTLYVCQNFWDEADQLFFYTDAQAEALIARKKEVFDNVIPASNSLMARALNHLAKILDRKDFGKLADLLLSKTRTLLTENPEYLSNWGCLATQYAKPTAEIAIVGPQADALRKDLQKHYLPNVVFAGTTHTSTLPLLANRTTSNAETLIYVCFDKACLLPVREVSEALLQLS